MSQRRVIPSALLALALGCGGGPSGEGAEAGGGTGSAGGEQGGGARPRQSAIELIGINSPERPWSAMAHEERELDMVGRFLPIMTELFQRHDAGEHASFGCETCHGTDLRERAFEMPSPHLPAVSLPGTPAYRQMADEHPEATRFMEEEVTPAMQTMLGMGATFTCNGCHPIVIPPHG